ncbi:AraC family transcriptional regulator ligand-binding domain-containing protein [Nocardia sp. NBC_00511]|uniref:AraC family transcriptional regulator n=1 Tax=Nocardia sp. NBC_00511 TaxID=2903591 RepID=UPI0030E1E5C6
MLSLDALRPVTSAALLADFAAEHGVDAATSLLGTGMTAARLADADAEITAGQELQLVRNIVRALGDRPGLGFEVGPRYRAAIHGIWGYALISSPTVGQAIQTVARYFELSYSYSRASLEISGDEARIGFDDSDIPADVRGFLLERDVSGSIANWREVFQRPLSLRRIEIGGGLLSRLRPLLADMGVDAEVIAAPGETHFFVVEAAILAEPMPAASPETARLLEQQCAALLHRRVQRTRLAGEVRDLLVRRGQASLGQTEVAAALHMSVRTLRRRLVEEGTSFRDISAETFGILAEELLSTGLPVEQVAYRLGYAGAPSFTTAFKQWRGITPGRFAREHPGR